MTTTDTTEVYGVWRITMSGEGDRLFGCLTFVLPGWVSIEDGDRKVLGWSLHSEVAERFEKHLETLRRTYGTPHQVPEDFTLTWDIEPATNEWVNSDGTQTFFVTVYEASQGYGGPEEGGWWFETGTPIRHYACRSWVEAEALREELRNGEFPDTGKRYSVLPGDDYGLRIGVEPGKAYPEEYPRYE